MNDLRCAPNRLWDLRGSGESPVFRGEAETRLEDVGEAVLSGEAAPPRYFLDRQVGVLEKPLCFGESSLLYGLADGLALDMPETNLGKAA